MGHNYQIKGFFYEADLPQWDMIMGFNSLDIAHIAVLSDRRSLLLEETNKIR